MKRVLSLVLAVMLVMALVTGCGSKDTQQTVSTAGTSSASSTSSPTANEMPKTPITFKIYMGPNMTQNWDTPVEKKITELTGVTLDVEKSVGDRAQRISLMAASGDLPDIIGAGSDLKLLLDVNSIEKMDDLIDQYGPNIKKVYGDYLKRLKWSNELPNIYCLGDAAVGGSFPDQVGGFTVQHAVVKEEGYPKLRTVADYENVIKAYYAKHPTFKGPDGKEQPTIPILLNGYDWGYFFSIGNPANSATGGFDDEWVIDQKTLEAKRHMITDSNKEYFKWVNGLWNQNLIDKESFTETDEQYKAKLSSGRVLASICGAGWEFQYSVHPALKAAGMEDRCYGAYPITMNENIKVPANVDKGYVGFGSGMAITTKCKDKVRAMQFLNWMASDEAQVLNAWGIEGVHWKYDENKKRVFLPEIAKQRQIDKDFGKKSGLGLYTYGWPRFGDDYLDSTGNPVAGDVNDDKGLIANYSATEKEVLSKYGVTTWRALFPQKSEFPVVPYGAAYKYDGALTGDYNAISNKCLDLSKKYGAKLIMAKPGQFDTVWASFVKDMEAAGVRDLESKFTQILKDRLDLWK